MHRSDPSQLVRLACAVILLGASTACGNLTAGGIGEATVLMSGDAPETGAAQLATIGPQSAIVSPPPQQAGARSGGQPPTDPLALSGPGPVDDDDNDPEGQFEADLTIFLVAADGTVVPVTDDEIEVRLDLEGVEEPEIGYRRVTAATYDALRLVFTDVEVQVDQGLVISGQEFSGAVDIEFDDLTLTVDKPLDLEIGDGDRVEILVDLNADSWLLSVDPTTEPATVDAQTFADLVTVRVR